MKYSNAKKVLPKDLLDEVRNYIQGEYLYIPKADGTKKKWGDKSGYRRSLSLRNEQIRDDFHEGMTIDELADRYYLAENTIKKIVYTKNITK